MVHKAGRSRAHRKKMSSSRGEERREDEIDLAAALFRRPRRRRPPPPPPPPPELEPPPRVKTKEGVKKPEAPPPPPEEKAPRPLPTDAFLRRVEKKLRESRPISDEKQRTIYPVPPEFLHSDEDVGNFYKPKVVSIGPYHKGTCEESLRPMEAHKWTCLYKLIHRHHPLHGSPGALMLLLRCLNRMIDVENWIREHYSKEIELDSEELALRMLLDGGFILYLLLKEAGIIETQPDDVQPVVGRRWIWQLVKYDLLLLDNQIPFLVIKELRDILVTDGSNLDLVDSALRLFSRLDPCRKQAQSPFYTPVDDVLHLLHLVYSSVLPCPQYYNPSLKPPSQQWIPSATKLEDFGVKFKKRENENKGRFLSFLDIKFNNGVMEIPQLRVHDYSVSLFRNLVAFEHCHPDTNCHITAYAALMNCLIDEEEDRRSLHLDQILVSSITTKKDATRFFRRLCNGAHCAPEKNYLGGLINDVNKYHERTWRQWRAQLARFRGPWPIFALAVTMFALLFSITQGSISIHFNFQPRH